VSTEQLAILVPAALVIALAYLNFRWQRDITKQTLEHQERINRDNDAHESKLAVQARAASTYEDMMEMVHWQMDIVDETKPIMSRSDAEPSNRPTDQRAHPQRAGPHQRSRQPGGQGSWNGSAEHRNDFFNDARYLDAMQNSHSQNMKADYGITLSDQWRKVDGALQNLVRELADAPLVVSFALRPPAPSVFPACSEDQVTAQVDTENSTDRHAVGFPFLISK